MAQMKHKPRGWPIPPECRDVSVFVQYSVKGKVRMDFSPLDVFDVLEMMLERKKNERSVDEIYREMRDAKRSDE